MAKPIGTPTEKNKGLRMVQNEINEEVEETLDDGQLTEEEIAEETEEEELDTNDDSDSDTEEEEADTDAEEIPDEEYEELDFLGNKKRVSKAEAKILAQKGLNYDYVLEKTSKQTQEIAELKAKAAERDLVDSKEALKKDLTKDGYYTDEEAEQLIMNNPAFKKMADMQRQTQEESHRTLAVARRSSEMDALKNEKFFDEVKPELEKLIQVSQNDGLTVDFMYEHLVGKFARSGKLKDLVTKARKNAIADIHDNSKRGKVISGDASSGEAIDVSRELSKRELEMTEAFGNDPKEIARYKKQYFKKKG